MEQQPGRPGFSILIGPDLTLLRAELDRLLASAPPPWGAAGPACSARASPGVLERRVFWGDEGLPDKFWEYLTLQGLFAAPKLLVVRNAQNLPADSLRKLSAALARPNDLVWPVLFVETPFVKGGPKLAKHLTDLPAWRFAEKKGWLRLVPGLEGGGLQKFVRQLAGELSLSFEPGSLEELCAVLPKDASAIRLEMEKIALAAQSGLSGSPDRVRPPGLVLRSDVALVDFEPRMDVFTLLRALQGGRNRAEVWRQATGGGELTLFAFLGLLQSEARSLWRTLAGEETGLPPSVASAKLTLAKKLGFSGLARIWHLALQAEKAVKSGEQGEEQCLEKMLADLFILFA